MCGKLRLKSLRYFHTSSQRPAKISPLTLHNLAHCPLSLRNCSQTATLSTSDGLTNIFAKDIIACIVDTSGDEDSCSGLVNFELKLSEVTIWPQLLTQALKCMPDITQYSSTSTHLPIIEISAYVALVTIYESYFQSCLAVKAHFSVVFKKNDCI